VLDSDLVASVVRFYALAEFYISAFRDYKFFADQWYSGQNMTVSEEVARNLLQSLKAANPDVTDAAREVCRLLCSYTGIPQAQIRVLSEADAEAH